MTGVPSYAGPERRARTRTPPLTPQGVGRARVHPAEIHRPLGIDPTRWYPVIEQPADVLSAPLPGYVWLDDGGHYRHVRRAFLELE